MADKATLIVECTHCNAHVMGRVEGHYDRFHEEAPWPERLSLLKCVKCSSPILVIQDIFEANELGETLDNPSRLYPSDDRYIREDVPDDIRRIFQEADVCFKAKAYTATAILCRKFLEAICIERGSKKRNLNEMLRELKDQGVVGDKLYDWSTALRMAGNEAAHAGKVLSNRQDAQDLLDFSEAIADYIYVLDEKYKGFQERRKKAAAKQP